MSMKISDLGEFGLIDRIGKTAPRKTKRVPIGIGDDAAALLLSPSSALLATTDMLIEGVHFDLTTTDLYSLGWKAAAVNLSDIAAMGGVPRFCLTALGIPPSFTVEDIGEFYRGVTACLKKFETVLVGGDTCSSKKGFVISVTVLGEVVRKQVVTRSGARPGDLIYVTGMLGDSAAGLEILKKGSGARGQGSGERRNKKSAIRNTQSAMRALIERHLRPVPRVAEGRKLALSGLASAMIDVSDGLSSDLGHICKQSGVGAEVFAERIPLSKELRSAKGLKQPPVEYALSGGEDYELLFTSPVERERELISLRVRATVIGAITRKKGMRMATEKGEIHPLAAGGYEHFRSGRGRGSAR
jgi:thiamine-monophosphate kinase